MDRNQEEEIEKDFNLKTAIVHIKGDLYYSIGVFLSSLIIFYNENLKVFDPLCTILFSYIVFKTTVGLFKDSIAILMECNINKGNQVQISRQIQYINSVTDIKSLHIWCINPEYQCIAVNVLTTQKDDLNAKFNI